MFHSGADDQVVMNPQVKVRGELTGLDTQAFFFSGYRISAGKFMKGTWSFLLSFVCSHQFSS